MSKIFENYEDYKEELNSLYDELLTKAQDNKFLIQTKEEIKSSLEKLNISDSEKAGFLISLYSQIAEQTLSSTFEQALAILDKCLKLPKELEELDARVELLEIQKEEVEEGIADRQAKRPLEINQLIANEKLVYAQIEKISKDGEYTDTQKKEMIQQVIDNRFIKAMDSMGSTIGTLGAGGIVVPKKLFEVYLELNKKLTDISSDGDFTLSKL